MLLTGLLFASWSYACDQPYEEVSGYKIGCPFEQKGDFQMDDHRITQNGVLAYVKADDKNFKQITVIELDGNIEGLELQLVDGSDDLDSVFESLADQWGIPQYMMHNDRRAFKWRPEHNVIDYVARYTDQVVYVSKKLRGRYESNINEVLP